MKFDFSRVIIIFVLPQLARSIFNGNFVSILEAPWFAIILDEYQGLACGGTIISEDWILTAAHCIHVPAPKEVRTGASTDFSTSSPKSQVEEIIVHGGFTMMYDEETWGDADIALIKLKAPITFNKYQYPIKISSIPPKGGDELVIYGMGAQSGLTDYATALKTAVERVNNDTSCNEKLPFGRVTKYSFCAGNGTTDVRSGDSGSGAVINGELVGIVSWAVRDSNIHAFINRKMPGVFTKVHAFRDWIAKHTGLEY